MLLRVDPAPAGMVRKMGMGRTARRRRPRTRGDGPRACHSRIRHVASTPHPRGWSGLRERCGPRAGVDPAPAGMVRSAARPSARPMCRPRTCGDGPSLPPGVRRSPRSTPHLRGWSDRVRKVPHTAHVDPAPAGMVRLSPTGPPVPRGRPRTCGDGPTEALRGGARDESTPHLRGWSLGRGAVGRSQGVAPAPAGMVSRRVGSPRYPRRRPRTCGDGPGGRSPWPTTRRSTPHLRGWSRGSRALPSTPEVDPAPAGMVPRQGRAGGDGRRRPRTCGDGPAISLGSLIKSTSTPHAWGWSLEQVAQCALAAVSTPHPRGWSVLPSPVRPYAVVDPAPAGMAPPRAKPGTKPAAVDPALAGMVPRHGGRVGWCGRRPRTCGDGPRIGINPCATAWSTPHPRGWSAAPPQPGRHHKGDPAPAGMAPASCRCTSRGRRRPAPATLRVWGQLPSFAALKGTALQSPARGRCGSGGSTGRFGARVARTRPCTGRRRQPPGGARRIGGRCRIGRRGAVRRARLR